MVRITVFKVAKYFLTFDSMFAKKLKLLCYYAYVWHLTLHGYRLFPNNFEAWVHGPTDVTLSDEFHLDVYSVLDASKKPAFEEPIGELLDEVYSSYGHLSADQLVSLAKSEAPWIVARKGLREYETSCNPIDDAAIIEYYSKEWRKNVINQ